MLINNLNLDIRFVKYLNNGNDKEYNYFLNENKPKVNLFFTWAYFRL